MDKIDQMTKSTTIHSFKVEIPLLEDDIFRLRQAPVHSVEHQD